MSVIHDQKTLALEIEVRRFNARFLEGDSVLYIPRPGLPPEFDRLYSSARVEGGVAVVNLAGREGAVPISSVYTMPIETTHVRAPSAKTAFWKLSVAFVAGMASAVLLALFGAPANADEPGVEIIVQCHQPGDEPVIASPSSVMKDRT